MIPLHPEDWSEVVGKDLADFVGAGGAMVRFVVGDTHAAAAEAKRLLRQLASQARLRFFEVDGAQTKLHYPNEILAAVAEQIDFHGLMTSFLFQAVLDEGYDVPVGAEDFVLKNIATMNDVLPNDVHGVINARIKSAILRDRRLLRDVRYALWAIAREVLRGVPSGMAGDVPTRWLSGPSPSIRELRDFGIVQKVNRYNARGLLRSVLTWLPASQWHGSIVYVDAHRLAEPRNLGDGSVYYTRSALSDVYEVMREFIDQTDHMSHVLLVFAMPYEFLSIDPRGRGMGCYQALQFRVNSFADETRPNPLSNMVVLSEGAQRRSFSL